jgi:hypothetical protein
MFKIETLFTAFTFYHKNILYLKYVYNFHSVGCKINVTFLFLSDLFCIHL